LTSGGFLIVSDALVYSQEETDMLKQMTSGGTATKMVVLGIGNQVDYNELYNMASAPTSRNFIHVQDFSSLKQVEQQLVNTACSDGQ